MRRISCSRHLAIDSSSSSSSFSSCFPSFPTSSLPCISRPPSPNGTDPSEERRGEKRGSHSLPCLLACEATSFVRDGRRCDGLIPVTATGNNGAGDRMASVTGNPIGLRICPEVSLV
ncbi:hypothetical protein E2C01_049653 [Portunus trituberculatus]|uniref:Uncharacterized protein n=1 Tax=Portunus trituberculatus TaxID=210409 RepID=A0A5B7GDP6_PORTR|nr:hypothetical protein [Portunus trituberculatus]